MLTLKIPKFYTIPRWLTIVFLLLFFAGCKPTTREKSAHYEDFRPGELYSTTDIEFRIAASENIEQLNRKIQSENLTTLHEIIRWYRPVNEFNEGKYRYSVDIVWIDDQTVEVTITETGLPDDSVEGRKTILTLRRGNGIYGVISVKEAYRCYRGHKNWSAEICP